MLDKNFREFIELLERNKVKYLVVGGYAVGLHGFPRYTGDLDVYIAISAANAEKMLQVFRQFGFTDLPVTKDDFLRADFVIEIGREPLKIQVLTGIDGVSFAECYKNRVFLKEGKRRIPFIGFEQLLKNKSASPRNRDKIDLQELKKLRDKKTTKSLITRSISGKLKQNE